MERKSLDTIMVYNPTDKDYMLEWDKRFHRIPARNRNAGFGNGGGGAVIVYNYS
jgi:hypothetical protein